MRCGASSTLSRLGHPPQQRKPIGGETKGSLAPVADAGQDSSSAMLEVVLAIFRKSIKHLLFNF
jgi:hypothetical protein